MAHEAGEGSHALGMRAATMCKYCGKAGHSANECWTAHPEMKPAGRNKMRCFRLPEIVRRKSTLNNNTDPIVDYPMSPRRKQKRRSPIVDSGCTLHLTNDRNKLTLSTTTTSHTLIKQADGTTLMATHEGKMTLTHQTGKPLTLENVLHVRG